MRAPYTPGTKLDGGFRGYGWFRVPEWNLTIAAPPKGGSSSLKQFMWMNEIDCDYIPHNQVRGECYFVVRDPVERFCSLWRSKCRDRANIARKEVHGMTPQELLNHIQSGAKDVHWTPQVNLIGHLRPTLIPLERLNDWWASRGYGELSRFNETSGKIDVNSEEILNFYSKDKELHEKSLLTFDPNCV